MPGSAENVIYCAWTKHWLVGIVKDVSSVLWHKIDRDRINMLELKVLGIRIDSLYPEVVKQERPAETVRLHTTYKKCRMDIVEFAINKNIGIFTFEVDPSMKH